MSIKYSLAIFLALGFTCAGTLAQGLHADGKRIINNKGENVLLRGIGLGGWMLQEGYMLRINREGQQYRIRERIEELIGPQKTQEFYDTWLVSHTRKADVDSLKKWGFNSIRLPMHFNLFTLPTDREPVAGKDTWLAKGFALTDSLLAWCKANKMYLILDLHAAPGGQGNDLNIADRNANKPSLWQSQAEQRKTIALWRKLAERYVNEPWIGGYDILNEPNWGFTNLADDKNGTQEKINAPLQKFMAEITQAIREVDKNHLVIIEGNGWGNNYSGVEPTWDKNMALSFHKYWAYNDANSANHILAMRDKYNIPVWLGETGENSNVWFTEAVRLFENNNIGWAWWPLKKIGFNNPMEIRSNPEYEQVTNYLNGRGRKPSAETAFKGLMEIAKAARAENTLVHYDVIDALMRQPFNAAAKPFKNNRIIPGSKIRAVDYDLGKNGIAYFDKDTADYHVSTGKNTPGNKGRVYRNDGVDIRRDSTAADAFYVSDVEEGEWLQYTVDVVKAGNYVLLLKVSGNNGTGILTVRDVNMHSLAALTIPNSGSDKTFKEIRTGKIPLKAGKQAIRLFAEKGTFSISEIQFIR